METTYYNGPLVRRVNSLAEGCPLREVTWTSDTKEV